MEKEFENQVEGLPEVYFFPSLVATKWQRTTWSEVYNDIRSGRYEAQTMRYRRLLGSLVVIDENDPTKTKKIEDKQVEDQAHSIKHNAMPSIISMVELTSNGDGRKTTDQGAYTGIMMVDIDHIDGDIEEVRMLVNENSHTFLSHVTISGEGLRVFARVAQIPTDRKQFLTSWRFVNAYFAGIAGCKADEQCKNANRLSVLCHDPNVYFNPDAKPFDPLEVQSYEAERQIAKREADKNKTYHTTAEDAGETVRLYVERSGYSYVPGKHHEYIVQCLFWMNKLGVPEDDATAWAKEQFADSDKPDNNVSSINTGIYRDYGHEHGIKELRRLKEYLKRPAGSGGKTASTKEVEDFINERYQFRRNLFTLFVEYRWNGYEVNPDDNSMERVNDGWKPMDDIFENSLSRLLDHNGINYPQKRLHSLLGSDFIPGYHPLKEYLDACPEWDGHDYLRELADRVHCKDATPDTFANYFIRWYCGMVGCALSPKNVNQTVLVFVGKQGIYKSSFMEHLLPKELRPYFQVKANAQRMNKDDMIQMAECLIINLEEIDTMKREDLNQLKANITQTYVNERAAYTALKTRCKHIASFCGTGNNLQFLTDDTGNRRWLPFEIDYIESPYEIELNYRQLFAQIMVKLREPDFRYWFTREEVDEINERNKRYSAPDEARELVLAHFRKPLPGEAFKYYTSSQMLQFFGPACRVTARQVSRALRQLGFEYSRKDGITFWHVIVRSAEESTTFLPADIVEE